MLESRRRLLKNLAAAAGVLTIAPLALSAQRGTLTPQPLPSPNAPDPHVPSGLDGPMPTKEAKVIPPVNAKEIRDDVEKMSDLVAELKKQVESTNVSSTLSVDVVKKAQEIEKLAKNVKNKAKG